MDRVQDLQSGALMRIEPRHRAKGPVARGCVCPAPWALSTWDARRSTAPLDGLVGPCPPMLIRPAATVDLSLAGQLGNGWVPMPADTQPVSSDQHGDGLSSPTPARPAAHSAGR